MLWCAKVVASCVSSAARCTSAAARSTSTAARCASAAARCSLLQLGVHLIDFSDDLNYSFLVQLKFLCRNQNLKVAR